MKNEDLTPLLCAQPNIGIVIPVRVLQGIGNQQRGTLCHHGLAIQSSIQASSFPLFVRIALGSAGDQYLNLWLIHLHDESCRTPPILAIKFAIVCHLETISSEMPGLLGGLTFSELFMNVPPTSYIISPSHNILQKMRQGRTLILELIFLGKGSLEMMKLLRHLCSPLNI